MHSQMYTTAKAIQAERLARSTAKRPLEHDAPRLRERVGHNLISLGERLARIERTQELGEAA